MSIAIAVDHPYARMRAQEDSVSFADVDAFLRYNPATGELRWREVFDRRGRRCSHSGKIAGTEHSDGAIQVKLTLSGRGRLYQAHRIAWLLMTGQWPSQLIDHRDGDRGNNRASNLRNCEQSQNSCNRHIVSGRCRHKGVYFVAVRGKYAAQIKVKGVSFWLGLHDTESAAAAAYDTAAVRVHGDFARTNADLDSAHVRRA